MFVTRSLNSALSHIPDVQQYLGTTGCDKYGISALFLLLCFKSNPYSDFNLGFCLVFYVLWGVGEKCGVWCSVIEMEEEIIWASDYLKYHKRNQHPNL